MSGRDGGFSVIAEALQTFKDNNPLEKTTTKTKQMHLSVEQSDHKLGVNAGVINSIKRHFEIPSNFLMINFRLMNLGLQNYQVSMYFK